MLSKFFREFVKAKKKSNTSDVLPELIEQAYVAMSAGELRKAADFFKKILEIDPYHVRSLNDLGVCHADMGDLPEAARLFEFAYSLDDTYIAAVVNHAKMLNDQRRSDEALEHLKLARLNDPDFIAVDAIYSAICLHRGDVVKARFFQLKSWLANFDNLRLANGFLFDTAYADVPEKTLSAEHYFWAQTVKPLPELHHEPLAKKAPVDRRIRIGYWSPDFRNHSVRYFFRPLIENHDTERFEIFLYHDFHDKDGQTSLIEDAAEHFHSVFDLADEDFCQLIRAHDLDVLVELSGHSSHNRVNLLQHKLAPVQLTGFGYPPTTGLRTIDAKVLDPFVCPPGAEQFYSESPLILPQSFWCFDPLEAVPDCGAPPVLSNGYVTFGCIGNTAKITGKTLDSWAKILKRVPRSRLLIRSISFQDPAALRVFSDQLSEAEIPLNRVDLHPPAAGEDYYRSYNEVDIILDTFPFNGGTTSCFAVYMGVPIITMFGESLISRMGFSILSNVGASELAVNNAEDYVKKAVKISQDVEFLKSFRKHARQRMKESSLGNGKKFTKEFEDACEQMVLQRNVLRRPVSMDLLSADELVRRAYATLKRNQIGATARIVKHCLEYYPHSAVAHILYTHEMTEAGKYDDAARYLTHQMRNFSDVEKVFAYLNIVRCHILAGDVTAARESVRLLSLLTVEDAFDSQQLALYQAALLGHENGQATEDVLHEPLNSLVEIAILVPCDDVEEFSKLQARWSAAVGGLDVGIRVVRCMESQKVAAYEAALQDNSCDILIIAQKNIDICRDNFAFEVIRSLDNFDVVGFAGAVHWKRLHWITDSFTRKCGAFVKAGHLEGGVAAPELMILGEGRNMLVGDMRVLDGGLIAIRCSAAIRAVKFDELLADAGTLMEQDWTHRVAQAGLKIGVHRNLGIVVDEAIPLNFENRIEARSLLSERMGFDIFSMEAEDRSFVSLPLHSNADSVNILNRMFA
ncbi:hypothetical protein [Xylophilus sp. GOD-11R]|uniref:O-linked N-acetylglucosamine transferase family protein n=1 Tax=Xylophilus sp. GOD-11R TaxID=3089814 RepID=UPI00298D30D7|nr:hypothetical protein [Xylophilus sp. GOD-11R]WPB56867.1 hypothetical protein R9X41_22485 [Xylophilus sp. GOD-11R]